MNKESVFHNLLYIPSNLLLLFVIFLITKNIKISIILLLILLFFFRNNYTNTIEPNNNYFLSPSSSTIIKIKEKKNYYKIKTFLSIYDRHFMIMPVDCKVIKIIDKKKKNDVERKRVILQDKYNNIFYLDQIVSKYGFGGYLPALFIKERCVLFCKEGDYLKQGERYGLIRFGSNMKYKIPKMYNINIVINKHYNIGEVM